MQKFKLQFKNGEAKALVELIQIGQIKSCSKIRLKSCKTSENVYDHVPSGVGPTSYIWNFTKFQIGLWKLIKPLFDLRFKLFEF